MSDHPAPPREVTHDECPGAATAEELQALLDHLAKYQDPENLAGHLLSSHSIGVRFGAGGMPALRDMHGTVHERAIQAAFSALPGCADAAVS